MNRLRRASQYFQSASTPIEEVRPLLWNSSVTPSEYGGDQKEYQAAVMEQYKLYVEMADRVSARRTLANSFFLTLNTSVFVAVGVFWKDRPAAAALLLVFPLIALLVQCGAWFFLVRSYRQLNTAKYTVIGALEEKLPASPYWRSEWVALGEGKDQAKYWPLTHLEQWVPVAFAAIYLVGAIAAMAA